MPSCNDRSAVPVGLYVPLGLFRKAGPRGTADSLKQEVARTLLARPECRAYPRPFLLWGLHMTSRFLTTTLLLAFFAVPASAGIFGSKKPAPKPDPKDRVNELMVIVKTDRDESKRFEAAEELRQYDPKAFPDIVPVLIDVLMNDPKPSVRAEAAQSLGKIRPVSQPVGMALEQALAKDTSMRVRLQARSSLLQYHWAGYKSPKDGGPPLETREPPLALPLNDKGPPLVPAPIPVPPPAPPAPARLTPIPAPQRTGPPLVPAEPPLLQPTPASGQGPPL